jgi:sugar/nucleoside kinase (ribokinase family)
VPELDLLTVGRVNFDLYAQQAGLPFAEVRGWDSMVGGSPANAAVAAARLGVAAGLVSAVGEDLVGEWVLRDLQAAGVDTSFVGRMQGPHTSLALRAQLAPDHPLAFYRHDPADIHVTLGDVKAVPVEATRAVLISADAFARGSMALAALSILRRGRAAERTVYLDLDLREVNWPDRKVYADAVAFAINEVDVLLGTEEEFAALIGRDPARDAAGVAEEICRHLAGFPDLVVVLKQGSDGIKVFSGGSTTSLPAFPADEVSSVGAGDSFAGGLVAARLDGSSWEEAARFATACAAITVGRPGCSAGFPRRAEAEELLAGAEVTG